MGFGVVLLRLNLTLVLVVRDSFLACSSAVLGIFLCCFSRSLMNSRWCNNVVLRFTDALNPKLLPRGGATELTVSATLKQKSALIERIEKLANGENAWIGIDENTEVDAFKDIAERSTHVILATCGLLTSSDEECFYVYVMDVVNSALSEKLGRC
ncbi:T-complex protein 1 subunit gamma [Dionaea muscipula]